MNICVNQAAQLMILSALHRTGLLLAAVALLALGACQGDATTASSAPEAESTVTPEPPKKPSNRATIADVEAGIRAHISQKTEEGDGFFDFEADSTSYRFKLVRVHTQYLSVLGPNSFFACVDLADESGDVYDVDFFLEGKPGNMHVTSTKVHKLNGKPRYTWKQNKQDKTWYTVPVENADNSLLGVIEGSDAFEFRYATTLPEITQASRVWLPIATSDAFQEVELKAVESPVEYTVLEETHNGNTVLYAELAPEHTGKELVLTYSVARKEKSPYPAPNTNLEPYLQGTEMLPTGGRFQRIADSVLAEFQAETELMRARALYDYIIDNMRYAKQGTYGTGDANFACDSRSGNCTEFHSYFISLARTAGIPARFAIGAAIPSNRNEGGVNGYHCWAEFYAENKWWPVDISEGNKYSALATYYFGHHPANRLEFSRGRDLQFEPGPQSGPVSFFAYPIFEEGGDSRKLKTRFSFQREA